LANNKRAERTLLLTYCYSPGKRFSRTLHQAAVCQGFVDRMSGVRFIV